MSTLATITNIKIPYPVEGIIRTSQLDDTISPGESVQLAVNMNFDRVGAVQTRLGVSEYANDLNDSIKNFGTLRNSIVPNGASELIQFGQIADIIEEECSDPCIVKISDTKVIVFWQGVDNNGFCRLYEIDSVFGTINPLGSVLEFDTANATGITAIKIDANRVLAAWAGSGNDGYVQAFTVSGDTPVALGSALEYDTANGTNPSLAQIDSTHVICFYTGTGSTGIATVFAIDGSGNVTEPGSPLTFENTDDSDNKCAAIGNGTHFINFWMQNSIGYARTFSVNTGTWAITAIGTALSYEAIVSNPSVAAVGDGQHFVNSFSPSGTGIVAQVFNVNPSTYAVTEVGTPVTLTTSSPNENALVSLGDGENFVSFYTKNVGDGYVQLLNMNTTTFAMSLVGSALTGYDFANEGISPILVSDFTILTAWAIDDEVSGKSAYFKGIGDVVNGQWLYAAVEDEVSNWDGANWTVRRSGLAEVSKPRFDQYLNYIWMVNGNSLIGGDGIATSDGGDFGTDLVPENFPGGDFINTGFEGRVWVFNKTLGTIYYTDIVQFAPPNTYVLTYNAEVNFISTISPQTGEQFTAVYQVPRALLVFTQNTITRIYGATSLDAYPAYNVGTFSQESIAETKTGIFFHHSSGFYQFDYGSQPVEISRRIIDFVKAIPRSYYESITGVYDGFDAVEWNVGPVTVEGVAYGSCVLRYTISTQVWTVYDYKSNVITAMIYYDDGTSINHLMGTSTGKVGAMDSGYTDFGQPFYYEMIDRWRGFTDMYYQSKSISGFNVYTENAAGANLSYQIQKSGPNAWKPIGTISEKNNALLPNSGTEDFDVLRLRIAGNTKGTPVVIHGIEITQLTIKGQEQN